MGLQSCPHRSLVLGMTIVCTVCIAQAAAAPEIDCTIASTLYWPSLTWSTGCTGDNQLWAYNMCWRMERTPEDWNLVCPAGCIWRCNPAGCVAGTGEQRLAATAAVELQLPEHDAMQQPLLKLSRLWSFTDMCVASHIYPVQGWQQPLYGHAGRA
jgi:hypothetical protein